MSQKKKPESEERDYSKEIKQIGFLENVSQKSLQNIHEAFLREENVPATEVQVPPPQQSVNNVKKNIVVKAPLTVPQPQVLKMKAATHPHASKQDGLPKSFFIFFVILLVLLVFLLILEAT